MSSSCKKCVFHRTTFRVASALQSCKPHQSQTVVWLLHQNHFSFFSFFFFPNANYCSPDRRHKHTTALNIKTLQARLSSAVISLFPASLGTGSHTGGISQAGAPPWPFTRRTRTLSLLLLVAHHSMLYVGFSDLQPFGSRFFLPSCDTGAIALCALFAT